jgi:hypothetical protein
VAEATATGAYINRPGTISSHQNKPFEILFVSVSC